MWGKTCVFCVFIGFQAGGVSLKTHTYTYVFIVLLLVCAYKAWVISPPAPPPPLPPTLPPLSPPHPLILFHFSLIRYRLLFQFSYIC
jgi:hypothetical protein